MTFKKPKASELKMAAVVAVTPTAAEASAAPSAPKKQQKNPKQFSQKAYGNFQWFIKEEALAAQQRCYTPSADLDSDDDADANYVPR